MPNRLLRDTTDSVSVDKLSYNAEVLFYRLMMKADDYGSFHGSPKLLKASLFPHRIDTIRDADISRWVAECEQAGLIVIYEDAARTYLRIVNFGQRLRNKRNIFPACPPELLTHASDLQQSAATRGDSPPEENRIEKEVEGVNNDIFFQMFRRAAGKHITDDELLLELARFKNKYPNVHSNRSGALINTWVANIGKEKKPRKKESWEFI